jgi:hypothetical protein
MNRAELKAKLSKVTTPVTVNHPVCSGTEFYIVKLNRTKAELKPVNGGRGYSIPFELIRTDEITPTGTPKVKKPEYKQLQAYMDEFINSMRSMCNMELVPLPTDEKSAESVISALQTHASPENLTCDGELSRTEINRRERLIRGAVRDLQKMLGRTIDLEEW